MSQICIARNPEDLHLLAEAETFMNAMRLKPEGSLAEVLGGAPGIEVLETKGDGLHVRTSPVPAIDVLTSPTKLSIRAGDSPARTITLTPEQCLIDEVVSSALTSGPGTSGPGGTHPSRGMKG